MYGILLKHLVVNTSKEYETLHQYEYNQMHVRTLTPDYFLIINNSY